MKEIVVVGLKNCRGGIENYLLSMQQQLSDKYMFCYLLDGDIDFYKEEILQNNGKYTILTPHNEFKVFLKELCQYLDDKKKTTNILYININILSFDILYVILGLWKGYKVVVHSHSAMLEPLKSFKLKLRHYPLQFIAKRVLALCNIKRLAVSERASKFAFGNKSYEMVHPGMEMQNFVFEESLRNDARGLYKAQEKKVFLFVGRLAAVKNVQFVLQIFFEIKRKDTDSMLWIVGDGEELESLKATCIELGLEKDVVFVGQTAEVRKYMCGADYLIAPSLSEGMPFVIMEAQALGLPSVCSEGRFPKEIAQTPLVSFMSLDEHAKEWAIKILGNYQCNEANDRKQWNAIMRACRFEIKNAAKILDLVLESL